jgi:type IV pilus assembly protein PilY1
MRNKIIFNTYYAAAGIALLMFSAGVVNAQMSQSPMAIRQAEPPLVLLTVGRDEKLFNAAYNDYSDIDGDGSIDVLYKPGVITYYGLFDSNKCYTYSTGNQRFEPASPVINARFKTCSGRWSGDFLNYITTSRADALRVVFYGGKRITPEPPTETIIERAFIPQDAHAWGKEYNAQRNVYETAGLTGTTQLTYRISDYTPFAEPSANDRQHLFGNTTINQGGVPLLRVLTNRQERIWNWVAKEGPVVGGNIDATLINGANVGGGGVAPQDFVVRVLACVKSNAFPLEENCKGYPEVNSTVWRPTGILHDYGEVRDVAFGLLTGSYENPRAGGVLRKNIDYFTSEVNPATGAFIQGGIVTNLDAIRISGWNGNAGSGGSYNCVGEACRDYGNPIAEMMLEGVRYLAGGTTPTTEYNYTHAASVDEGLGLSKPNWLAPYRGKQAGGFAACSKPVQMVVSDVTPTFDSDQLPSSPFPGAIGAITSPATMSTLNVASLGQDIWNTEGIASANFFIGHSLSNIGNQYDQAPTPKLVNSFHNIRGLAPSETTRQGSYNAASIAKFGANKPGVNPLSAPTFLIPDANDPQNVETYAIALTPALPTIKLPFANGSVSVVPFAKSVGGCNFGEFVGSGPNRTYLTNRIAGFNFISAANIPGFPPNPAVNAGRPYARFIVSFEDNEQGTDNDMDAIAQYEVFAASANTVQVKMVSQYSAGCIDQSIGFVISGTVGDDGAHLGVRDVGGGNNTYVLNDPAPFTFFPGIPPAGNIDPPLGTLGTLYDRTFNVNTNAAVNGSIPHDPLWYAAKYGVAVKYNDPTPPNWDANNDGSPDNYALVTNPAKLRAQISAALDKILENTNASLAVTATGGLVRTGTLGFQSSFKYGRASIPRDTGTPLSANVWTGTVEAKTINSDGSLGATNWVTTPSSIAAAKDRPIYTRIVRSGTPEYADLTASVLADDPALETVLAPSSLQTVLSAKLQEINGGPLSAAQQKRNTAVALINYLRGDQRLEKGNLGGNPTQGVLRPRESALGDIVHSTPVYQGPADYGYANTLNMQGRATYKQFANSKSLKRVFVGANDGMLHAFDATNGALVWSFMPSVVQSEVWRLAAPGYTHRYYVDGQVVVGDVYSTTGGWRTILVAALGAGGRSVVALDVTSSTPVVLWELRNLDDLGYVIGDIQIARIPKSNDDWAVIFGNGYETTVPNGNSTKSVAKLFVVNAVTGAVLAPQSVTVPDSVAYNGLGSPGVSVENNTVSSVWAGDLGGNLWKFNLKTGSISYPGNVPLFKAVRNNTPQPITAAPAIARSLSRGYYVSFGTGKFFQDSDRLSTNVQSIYTIRDATNDYQVANNSPSARYNLARADLNAYTITSESGGQRTLGVSGTTLSSVGWYLDLVSSGGATGERLLAAPQIYFPDAFFGTFSASQNVCDDGSSGWFMGIPVDSSTDPIEINSSEVFKQTGIAGISLDRGLEGNFGPIVTGGGSTVSFIGVIGQSAQAVNGQPSASRLKGIRTKFGRQNWRQIR